jgi:opacity protein-like surface antigen
MKTMKTLRTCLLAGLVAALTSPCLRADDPGARMSIEAGASYGQLDITGGTSELVGAAAALNFELGKFLMTDLGVRADYSYLESKDAGLSFKRELFDGDVRFGVSVVGIFKPYVSLGVSYHRYDAPGTFVENDWKVGGAAGAGVGITLIPKLLHITPSIRYVSYDSLETVTYALDTALHFSVLGVGLRLSYEDDRTHEAHLSTATLYAALRF